MRKFRKPWKEELAKESSMGQMWCQRSPVLWGLALCLGLIWPAVSVAQATKLGPLPLDGAMAEDGSQVVLHWQLPTAGRTGEASISRRLLGAEGQASWQELVVQPASDTRFSDSTTQLGQAYEYRVQVQSGRHVQSGYWVTGHQVPARAYQGVALVVVEGSLTEPLALPLSRYVQDLVGAGWVVRGHKVARAPSDKTAEKQRALRQAARDLRAWVRTQYSANPDQPHALILIGQVPVIKSGSARPDGHKAKPHATDLFYADVDGVWPDQGDGELAANSVPSAHIEMPVGRIDFSRLDPAFGDELQLYRDYFDKNHRWRHRLAKVPRQAYAKDKNLAVESNGLRNVLGPRAVLTGGHHDAGTRQPWLFGVDFGDWNGENYAQGETIKPVFAINFGSNKQLFERKNNPMRGLLAQDGYTLAVGWGGRPAWQLHLMGLGASIGEVQRRTVNNGRRGEGVAGALDYVPTGLYPWFNPIWVNLMGDPTLSAFGTPPVTDLTQVAQDAGTMTLQWVAPEVRDIGEYRVYSSPAPGGPYRLVEGGNAVNATQITLPVPAQETWYMVRSRALINVHAGSFYALSQGAFQRVEP